MLDATAGLLVNLGRAEDAAAVRRMIENGELDAAARLLQEICLL